ncbi:MAG: beta-N-acetylhexosaminidase [Acidocella sp. 20-57-95]|nr:MAG: beta-N-acetylhexosaminidase [Acidocella sp. 20-57-95]OYV59226.1 MAG: beta-N-acetylhexosaminidase [Acidocella sp. 21-58-7]HQT64620.1 beta-N-acetylhexosaminidase [Acidocella sp.]
MIIGLAGPELADDEAQLLREYPPRGVILFSRNISTPFQVRQLNAILRQILAPDAVLMVDQEGGRVARLRAPHWRNLPPAAALKTPEAALAHGKALGVMVKEAGFTMTAAPVLDLRYEGASDVVGDRALSHDPQVVAALGAQIAEGIMAAGITPIIKHIPGHGRAQIDSHEGLPKIARDADLSADFFPFIANNKLPWAMTAHIVYEAYDTLPATLSAKVIAEIIRGKIGFTGTLVSDDLAMGALSGTPAERAVGALQAGCDVALYCPGDMAGNRAVLEAVANGH